MSEDTTEHQRLIITLDMEKKLIYKLTSHENIRCDI